MRKIKYGRTKGKKIVSVVMLSAMLVSLGMTYAQANNHHDTLFQFNLGASGYEYTAIRAKEDDTSSYIYYESGSNSIIVSVVAAYNGADRASDNAVRRVNRNIEPGNWYYLINYIREDGFDYASIRGESRYGAFTATGVWSPDSI